MIAHWLVESNKPVDGMDLRLLTDALLLGKAEWGSTLKL
jgi:hypothetical protein